MKTFLLALTALGAIVLIHPLAAVPARADTTITGPGGRTITGTTERTPGSKQVEWTDQQGRTYTRDTTYGGGTGNTTVTGPGGRTVTRSAERMPGSSQVERTGRRGRTYTRNTTY